MTAQQRSRNGWSARQMVLVRRKEIELHRLNIIGHKQVKDQLNYIQDTYYLTSAQAKALNEELTWRKQEIKRAQTHIVALEASAVRWAAKVNNKRTT